ncbi:MAG TPA: Gfo/Idh/MocA family oxidoreductase [Pirellulales bacterium]
MTQIQKIHAAVVGAGHLGKHHSRILSGLPGVELVAVVDANKETAAQVAGQYGAQGLTDYRELIGKVDAVVIATPTIYHADVAVALLEQGVHCLVEKPMATNFADARRMVEAASVAGATLAVGHTEQFNPAWQAVIGSAAQPRYIEAVRQNGYTLRATDIGVVFDLMIHDLDLVLSLVKHPVERIEATGVKVFGGHEDVCNARLTFTNGCVANLTASRASHTPVRAMQIWSANSFASVDFATRSGHVLHPHGPLARGEVNIDSLSPAERDHMRKTLFEEQLRLEQLSAPACDQLTAENEDFLRAIREGRRPRVDGRQACTAIAVAERILAKLQLFGWNGQTPHSAEVAPVVGAPLAGPHFLSSARRRLAWDDASDER